MSTAKHPAAVDVAGTPYLRDAKGSLVPLAAVKPVDLLMDETVRAILTDARELSALIAAFKARTFERVGAFPPPGCWSRSRWRSHVRRCRRSAAGSDARRRPNRAPRSSAAA